MPDDGPGPGGDVAPAKVLLVDDHDVVRSGLALIVNQMPGMVVCGTAAGPRDGLAQVEALKPDLVVTDLALGAESGFEFIRELQVRWPDLPILVLSMTDENAIAEPALLAGASGYVMKDASPAKLELAMRRVLLGKTFVSEPVQERVMNSLLRRTSNSPGDRLALLSTRELQVLQLLGQGKESSDIADALFLSMKTVDTHRQNIKRKLQINGTNELIVFAATWARFGVLPSEK